jgi:hypothetical protein
MGRLVGFPWFSKISPILETVSNECSPVLIWGGTDREFSASFDHQASATTISFLFLDLSPPKANKTVSFFNGPVDPSEAHPRITARSERAHLHHPIGDAPGRVPRSTRGCTVTPDSEGQPYAERLRVGYFRMESAAQTRTTRLSVGSPGVIVTGSAGTSPRAGD